MVINKTCPTCKGRETYYKGKDIFYCKTCKKEFESASALKRGKRDERNKTTRIH